MQRLWKLRLHALHSIGVVPVAMVFLQLPHFSLGVGGSVGPGFVPVEEVEVRGWMWLVTPEGGLGELVKRPVGLKGPEDRLLSDMVDGLRRLSGSG